MKYKYVIRSRALILTGALCFCALTFVETAKQSLGQIKPQTPAEAWLALSEEARTNFVRGYLQGFERGKREACYFYEEKLPTSGPVPVERLPRRICLDSTPEFTEVGHYRVYVDMITAYYTKYPHDREGGLTNIMSELAVPPGAKNVDQIHAKLGD